MAVLRHIHFLRDVYSWQCSPCHSNNSAEIASRNGGHLQPALQQARAHLFFFVDFVVLRVDVFFFVKRACGILTKGGGESVSGILQSVKYRVEYTAMQSTTAGRGQGARRSCTAPNTTILVFQDMSPLDQNIFLGSFNAYK